MVRKFLKVSFLHVSKLLGLFHLSRRLTANGLRIVGYHCFVLGGEQIWRGSYFITPSQFERRLVFLWKYGFPVLAIDEALQRLRDGTLPARATVITIDDGNYSVYECAAKQLSNYGFKSILYVASYYCVKGTPVFGLVISFIFWKTTKTHADLSSVDVPFLADQTDVELTPDSKARLADRIVEFGEKIGSEEKRVRISEQLARCLDVDYWTIYNRRTLSNMSLVELGKAASAGMSLGLHTHRHIFPPEHDSAAEEICDNRLALRQLGGMTMRHFSYPDGKWQPLHWQILREQGIESAVTCDPGFNYANTPFYSLKRFLDSSAKSQIEFEAEMSGYFEIIHNLRLFWAGVVNL